MLITVTDNVPTGKAAEALDVHPVTLIRWMQAGIVTPAGKTAGGHYRWNLDDLRRQLAEHEAQRGEEQA